MSNTMIHNSQTKVFTTINGVPRLIKSGTYIECLDFCDSSNWQSITPLGDVYTLTLIPGVSAPHC